MQKGGRGSSSIHLFECLRKITNYKAGGGGLRALVSIQFQVLQDVKKLPGVEQGNQSPKAPC